MAITSRKIVLAAAILAASMVPQAQVDYEALQELGAALIGKPAPELEGIRAWKNGEPVTLKELRGKAVLLDFWGYWCGPCLYSMPRLMQMHEAFKDHGLVIIAVHEGSLEDIADLDKLLERPKQNIWGGRDIPFRIALEGGGPTPMEGAPFDAPGTMTAAYRIVGFPTTYLINKEGVIETTFHPSDPDAWQAIERVLGVTVQEPAPITPTPGEGSTRPAPQGPDWWQAFLSRYELEPLQPLKFIFQPFIPAREDYVKANLAAAVAEHGAPPDYLILAQEDLNGASWPPLSYEYANDLPLRKVLKLAVGLPASAVRGPEEVLEESLPGDWVIRRKASEAEQIAALQSLLNDLLRLGVKFSEEMGETDVIVVRGGLDTPAGAIRLAEAGPVVDGTFGGLLDELTRRFDVRFVNESSTPGDAPAQYVPPEKNATRAQALERLAGQTKLTFTPETRRQPIWVITKQ